MISVQSRKSTTQGAISALYTESCLISHFFACFQMYQIRNFFAFLQHNRRFDIIGEKGRLVCEVLPLFWRLSDFKVFIIYLTMLSKSSTALVNILFYTSSLIPLLMNERIVLITSLCAYLPDVTLASISVSFNFRYTSW